MPVSMPRTPKDPGDRINYAEKALAGPISKSAFQHLIGLDPPLVPAARIANALSREFDDGEPPSFLKEVAEHKAKAEELATLPAEPNDYWYHRLILQAECREMREILGRAEGKLVIVDGAELKGDDYWEHVSRLRERRQYYPGLVPAMPPDVRIEICDRRHVFMWPTSRLKSFWENSPEERAFREKHPWHPDHKPDPTPGFVGWIEDWERDTEMRFKHV